MYNPLPALGGTHLAALLADSNSVTTINSVLVVNYPTAVVLTPVTANAGGGGGVGIGSSSNYTNSPTRSPTSRFVVSTSNTTLKNYDDYIFIGAGVLGGIMLLGIGGSGWYYLKKRKEYKIKMQNVRNDVVLVVKPPVSPFLESRRSSAFSIRRNTVVPINYNDNYDNDVIIKVTSRVNDDEGPMHPEVDEYNLWGDLDIESSITPTPTASISPSFTPFYSGVATPLGTIKPAPNAQDLHSALSTLFGKVIV